MSEEKEKSEFFAKVYQSVNFAVSESLTCYDLGDTEGVSLIVQKATENIVKLCEPC